MVPKPCTPWDPITDNNQGSPSCRKHPLGYTGNEPLCGNSILEPPEQCDFGLSNNLGAATGCNPDCTLPFPDGDPAGGGDDTGASGGAEVGARNCTECVDYAAHEDGSGVFPMPPSKGCNVPPNKNLRGDPKAVVLEVTRAGKALYATKTGVHVYDDTKNTVTDYPNIFGEMLKGWSNNLRWFVVEEVMASRQWYDKVGAKYYLLDRRTNMKFPLPGDMAATRAIVSDDGTIVAAVQKNPTDTVRKKNYLGRR